RTLPSHMNGGLIFPALIERGDTDEFPLRVRMVQADHGIVRVWTGRIGHNPTIEHEAPGSLSIIDTNVPAGAWKIAWADGSTWTVRWDSDCGCSHPLKNFTPTPIPMPVPTESGS